MTNKIRAFDPHKVFEDFKKTGILEAIPRDALTMDREICGSSIDDEIVDQFLILGKEIRGHRKLPPHVISLTRSALERKMAFFCVSFWGSVKYLLDEQDADRAQGCIEMAEGHIELIAGNQTLGQDKLGGSMDKITKEHNKRAAGTAYVPPSRAGKKLISGHFDEFLSRDLKDLANLRETSVQALLEEAINGLLEKHAADLSPLRKLRQREP